MDLSRLVRIICNIAILWGAICEDQGHHANLEFGWGEVLVRSWTHKIDGLAEADFILAAQIDRMCL